MVSAYIKTPAGWAFRELLIRLAAQQNRRVTMQQAVCESLVDFFRKYGEEPPAELVAAAGPAAAAPPRSQPARISSAAAALAHYAGDETTERSLSREDTTMVSAHIKTRAVWPFRTLLARLSRERNCRVTTQQAVCESLVDFFLKYDEEPPAELVAAARPCYKTKAATPAMELT